MARLGRFRILNATTPNGKPVSEETFENDYRELIALYNNAVKANPTFDMFGGVLTVNNGNQYQVA